MLVKAASYITSLVNNCWLIWIIRQRPLAAGASGMVTDKITCFFSPKGIYVYQFVCIYTNECTPLGRVIRYYMSL